MGKDTEIAWTDHTFNHQIGCQPCSTGCKNCYAKTLTERFGHDFSVRRRTSAANWRDVERWNRTAGIPVRAWETMKQTYSVGDEQLNQIGFFKPHRPRVFCASMADWLDDADVVMPDGRIDKGGIDTLSDLLDLIRRTPNLDWLLLTKRPENWKRLVSRVFLKSEAGSRIWVGDWVEGRRIPPNVWVGVSAENQEYWDMRVPVLLSIPAKVRFVSVEPMLGPIDMTGHLWDSGCKPHCGDRCSKDIDCPMEQTDRLHWVIFGGESGPKARPCNVDWIRDGVRQCREAGVACFVKQDSSMKSGQQGRIPDELWRRKEWPTA